MTHPLAAKNDEASCNYLPAFRQQAFKLDISLIIC